MQHRTRFKANLTEGPIGKALCQLTLPMIGGMLAMMVFNIVDTYFVARLGSIPLAAMVYPYLRMRGFTEVRILTEDFADIAGYFKPGYALKHAEKKS